MIMSAHQVCYVLIYRCSAVANIVGWPLQLDVGVASLFDSYIALGVL